MINILILETFSFIDDDKSAFVEEWKVVQE